LRFMAALIKTRRLKTSLKNMFILHRLFTNPHHLDGYPCLITCWNDGNRIAQAYRHDSIEFMLAQHPWMENDCMFADIILPINTKFEEDDIGADTINLHFDTIFLSDKCVEPVGESVSDYEAVCAIADKLGLLKEYTEGKSVDEWIKYGFDTSGMPQAG